MRVKPGSRRNAVLGVHGGALKLAVIAPPERGKANRAVTKLLARLLDLLPAQVQLLGERSQDKTAFLPLPPAVVRARLDAHLAP